MVLQSYLVVLWLFHFLLFILPFHNWRRCLCRLMGIKVGKKVAIHHGVRFMGLGRCIIGASTVINRNCVLDNREMLIIGENVSIAMGTCIFTQGHVLDDDHFALSGAPVVIGDHVCVFSNAMIMPGVHLGRGAVVYAGSVVTKNVDDLVIVAGVPAKPVRMRRSSCNYKIDGEFWFA